MMCAIIWILSIPITILMYTLVLYFGTEFRYDKDYADMSYNQCDSYSEYVSKKIKNFTIGDLALVLVACLLGWIGAIVGVLIALVAAIVELGTVPFREALRIFKHGNHTSKKDD